MTRVLRPGWGTMAGLRWLSRVGPAPLDSWRCAMGWSEVSARSHARRLEREGWLARYPMRRGDGCLFVATRVGVAVAGVPVRAPGEPAPTWWAHHCGVAWMAAWLTVRGREFKGGRELLEFDTWSGEISWQDHKGFHDTKHRPDLVGFALTADRSRSRSSWRRSRSSASGGSSTGTPCGATLARATASTTSAVTTTDSSGSGRLPTRGRAFRYDDLGLTLVLLDTIKQQAIEMREADPCAVGFRRPAA